MIFFTIHKKGGFYGPLSYELYEYVTRENSRKVFWFSFTKENKDIILSLYPGIYPFGEEFLYCCAEAFDGFLH